MPMTGVCWRADLSMCLCVSVCVCKATTQTEMLYVCVCPCHCWATRCHWAGPRLMPWLQTQLTGWESSRFRYSHVFKYSSACSPLSAPCGISSLVLQGRGPVETWETLRGWVKKMSPPHPLLVAALCIARPLRTEGHKCICSRFPTSVREVFFGKMTKWLIPWLVVASLKPDSLNNWIHICATYQHCWWAQTVMWHLNILIKNACSEGKQRGAPARED